MFGLQKEILDAYGLKDKTEKNKHFVTSLEFAIQGIKTVFQEERNMRAHVVLG